MQYYNIPVVPVLKQEVPEHLLLSQFFFRFPDNFFFFIKKKIRRFLSSIFFDLLEHLEASSFHFLSLQFAYHFFILSSSFYLWPHSG